MPWRGSVWGKDDRILARTYEALQGWASPAIIDVGLFAAMTNIGGYDIGVDATGHAVVVWNQPTTAGSGRSIWSNSFAPGEGWSGAEHMLLGVSLREFGPFSLACQWEAARRSTKFTISCRLA